MATKGRENADVALLTQLASGKSIDAAAKAAHVSPTTAYRRMRDPEFRHRLADLKAEATREAMAALSSLAKRAAERLGVLMDDAESEGVCLGAARAILEMHVRYKDTVDLEQRVSALEAGGGEPEGEGGEAPEAAE